MKMLERVQKTQRNFRTLFIRAPHDLVYLIVRYIRISVLHRQHCVTLFGIVKLTAQMLFFVCESRSQVLDRGGQLVGRQRHVRSPFPFNQQQKHARALNRYSSVNSELSSRLREQAKYYSQ